MYVRGHMPLEQLGKKNKINKRKIACWACTLEFEVVGEVMYAV